VLSIAEDYVQETGRGGRDGNNCRCVLFYRDQDVETAKKVLNIKNSQENIDDSISKMEAVRRVSSSCSYVCDQHSY
jgi:ATP-dependent DNA helicase RecQ